MWHLVILIETSISEWDIKIFSANIQSNRIHVIYIAGEYYIDLGNVAAMAYRALGQQLKLQTPMPRGTYIPLCYAPSLHGIFVSLVTILDGLVLRFSTETRIKCT